MVPHAVPLRRVSWPATLLLVARGVCGASLRSRSGSKGESWRRRASGPHGPHPVTHRPGRPSAHGSRRRVRAFSAHPVKRRPVPGQACPGARLLRHIVGVPAVQTDRLRPWLTCQRLNTSIGHRAGAGWSLTQVRAGHGGVLAGEADQHLMRLAFDVVSAHPRLPAIRLWQRGQDPDRSRLTSPVGPKQGEDLPLGGRSGRCHLGAARKGTSRQVSDLGRGRSGAAGRAQRAISGGEGLFPSSERTGALVPSLATLEVSQSDIGLPAPFCPSRLSTRPGRSFRCQNPHVRVALGPLLGRRVRCTHCAVVAVHGPKRGLSVRRVITCWACVPAVHERVRRTGARPALRTWSRQAG